MFSNPVDRIVIVLAPFGAVFALVTPAAAAPGGAMLVPGIPALSGAPLVLAGLLGLAMSIRRSDRE